MYNKQVIEKFVNLENAGLIKNADGTGTSTNEITGETLKIYLQIENGVVVDAKFKAFGNVGLLCLAEELMSEIKGKSIDNLFSFKESDLVLKLGGLPQNREESIAMLRPALEDAVEDYYKKQEKQNKNS